LSYGLGRPDLALLLKFVRFGLPLVPAGYAIWALNLADRLFIAHYGTLQDLGVYSVVYSLGYMLINLFFNPIWLMYPPTAAELYNQGRLDELSNLFRHSTRLALGLLVPAMVGIGVLGVPIVRLFATEEFVRGASLVPLITLGYTFLMLSAYYEVALGLVERQVWSTINTGIAAVVNILLNFLLVPVWGIAGAAWVTAIGFGVQFCLSAWMGSRQVRLEFDWTFFAKACLASLGMGIALYLLPVQGVGVLALGVVAGAVVYGFLMLLLRALTPEEWKAALQVVGLGMIGRFSPVLPVSEGEGEAE
jgi:O-antigen/teichoic acid export membrane protein